MRSLVHPHNAHIYACAAALLFLCHLLTNDQTRPTFADAPRGAEWRQPSQLTRTGTAGVPEDLRAAVEEARYRLEPDATAEGGAGYRVAHPAQGWHARFGAEGLEIETRAVEGRAAQRFGMRLKSYGYGGRAAAVERAELVAAGNHLEYRRGSLVEWYLNERRGVEQGFTLREPPASGVAERARGESLTLRLAIEGDLRAELSADGQSIEFLDDAGAHTLTYDALTAFDASGRELPSRMRVEGREVHLEVNDAGAQYPLTIDPFIQQQRLQASDASSGDIFGFSVSVSGNTAIVGAYLDGNGSGSSVGSAYVFVRSCGVWTEQQRLQASDATHGDLFGVAVAVSGDTAVVGAGGNDTVAGQDAGTAYVFVRSNGVWTEQQLLQASDAAISDRFGITVSVDGDTAVVGAEADDNGGGRDSGSAYVFVRSGGVWTEQQRLQASDAAPGDAFGNWVFISGDTAIVAAYLDDNSGGANAGSAYIFVRSNGVWTEQQRLQASAAAAGDIFGNTVCLSGDTAIVGSYLDSNSAGASAGSAYIFVRSGGVWTEQQRLQASDAAPGDLFGNSVAVSGDTAVVAADEDDNSGGQGAGSAYVFTRSNGVWTERQRLQASDAAPGDLFGRAVSVNGDTIIVGADGNDLRGSNAGSAYVFHDPPPASPVIISEFRLAGPGLGGGTGTGADEFFELYNNTDSGITVGAFDLTGWTLRSSDGTLNFVIPPGDFIPARGHYLVVNSNGYSLARYPTARPVCLGGDDCAAGDRSYTSDTPENTGVALFRTANPAAFTLANRLDAAGPSTEANPLYREGAGYTPVTGATGAVQHSFVRRMLTGTPRDCDDNDFQLVATDGAATLPGAVLGAPGPENIHSPVQRNAALKASLFDAAQPSAALPNRVRSGAPDPSEPANSTRGTLKIRRKFTNATGADVTRLRFRVVDITATPRPDATTADLRVLPHSGGVSVTLGNGANIPLAALDREEPPLQTSHGGGLNTTLSATLERHIPPGASVSVEFSLGVIEDGNFRFLVNVEALTSPNTNPPAPTKAGSRGKRSKAGAHSGARATP